ncbi:hypothetical protein [Acetobacter malorum]|uniref:hypothetical protein n=1 Tax=Acetobacter malorum TaxID=178901 RepID=UPI0039EAF096
MSWRLRLVRRGSTIPNGDILVAESNSPKTDIQTLKNRIAGFVIGKVGAGETSPNWIILLRDSTGEGTADIRFIRWSRLGVPA